MDTTSIPIEHDGGAAVPPYPAEPHETAEARLRIFVRPIGTPLPLGFFAFGVGLVLLSGVGLGWFAPGDRALVARALLVFVVPLEVLAAIYAYLARDSAGATTMGLFAGIWAALCTTWLSLPVAAESPVLAVLLFAVSVAVLALAVPAWSAKPFMTVILVLAAARFILTGLFELGLGRELDTAGCIVGLVDAGFALYGGLGLLLEDTRLQTVLPLFRRGDAHKALYAGLDEQVRQIENEPGVRGQL